MPHSLTARFAIAFLLFVSGVAVWRGRTPERIGGIAAVLNEIIYLAVYTPGDDIHAQWEAMWLDCAFVIVLAFVAIRYDRAWAKWATAFELLIVGTHLAVAADLRIATYFAYWSAALWTQAMIWSLLIGTIQVVLEDRRLRRMGVATQSH